MKLGLIISGVIVAVVVAAFAALTLSVGEPTPPTAKATGDRLKKLELPATLPPVHAPADPSADATPVYAELLAAAQTHRDGLSQSPPAAEAVSAIEPLLVRAADAGRVDEGFLDKDVPIGFDSVPAWGDALELAWQAAIDEADRRQAAGDTTGAARLASAVWVLGQRAFERNTLLYGRLQGVSMMVAAGSRLYEWSSDEAAKENLAQWGAAVTKIDTAWNDKLSIVASLRPHVGDLLSVAQHDRDPTFRIAGTMRLAIAKFNPGGRANLKAIHGAIETGLASDDPRVVKAAEVAEAMTVEEMRRLK